MLLGKLLGMTGARPFPARNDGEPPASPPNTNGGKVAAAKPPDEWEGRKIQSSSVRRQRRLTPSLWERGRHGKQSGGLTLAKGEASAITARAFLFLVPLKRNNKRKRHKQDRRRGNIPAAAVAFCVLCPTARQGIFVSLPLAGVRLPFYRRLAGRLAFGDFDCLHRSTRTFAAFTKRLLIQPLPIKPFDAPILSYSITLCVH